MTDTESDDLEYEWGGDGSDLHEPVRAHVEAALVPTEVPYTPPLDQLLRIGDARKRDQQRPKIAKLGLSQEHIPELVRMARDRALNIAMSDTDEVWAPIHALTALEDENLDLSAVAADLVPLFDVDSDWFGETLPLILKNAGASALEPLQTYIQDSSRWIYGRAYAISAVEEIGKAYPELRNQAVKLLSDALTHADQNDPYVNADLTNALVELDAIEALPIIRAAFERDLVDESVMGGWSEVLEELGQNPDPDDPLIERSRRRWQDKQDRFRAGFPASLREPSTSPTVPARQPNKAAKRKNKRKASAAARKVNKRKRK